MMKLKKVTINRYKSIETEQRFEVEPDITVLVGQNESGKTAILEALTNSNPYMEDQHRYDIDRDFPRRFPRPASKQTPDFNVYQGVFVLSDELLNGIQLEVGVDTFNQNEVIVTRQYNADTFEIHDLQVDGNAFLDHLFTFSDIGNDDEYRSDVLEAISSLDLEPILTRLTDDGQLELVALIRNVFEDNEDSENPVRDYIAQSWLEPYLPKFLYYDEYYQLPPEINLYELRHNQPETPDAKTCQALLQLADVDLDLLLGDDDEKIERALEDASRRLTDTLRKYWTMDDAPRIVLRPTKASIQRGQPALIVRVENDPDEGSLPLDSRSKGFKYFFSFMVWFSRIQEDDDVEYILLLDEPGLSLHGSAQAYLLRFLEDLSRTYQIIYTTHSPFMIDSARLYRVRTVSKKISLAGTQISDNLYDGDRNALFPLQAALGVNITQSLFVGENNLIVEGISDVLYLSTMSSILRGIGCEGLLQSVILVPISGMDKAASFISLFHGNGLDIVCLLDTFEDAAAKQRVDDVIKRQYISKKSVRYFNEFADNEGNEADIEDMFEKSEYLKLYNETFTERRDIAESELDNSVNRVTQQIRKILKKNYNHTRPAKYIAKIGNEGEFLSQETLERFETMFKEINKQFNR